MTISELIDGLQETRKAFGDLTVVIYDDFGWKDPTPDDVRPTDIIMEDPTTHERKSKRVDAVRL